MIFKNILV